MRHLETVEGGVGRGFGDAVGAVLEEVAGHLGVEEGHRGVHPRLAVPERVAAVARGGQRPGRHTGTHRHREEELATIAVCGGALCGVLRLTLVAEGGFAPEAVGEELLLLAMRHHSGRNRPPPPPAGRHPLLPPPQAGHLRGRFVRSGLVPIVQTGRTIPGLLRAAETWSVVARA